MTGLIKEFYADKLHVLIFENRELMGQAASQHYLQWLNGLLNRQPVARAVFAAAHSQDDFLEGLRNADDRIFEHIDAFHMDEYIGLPADAPQRFGTFLSRAIFDRKPFRNIYLMNTGGEEGEQACARYARLIAAAPLDIVSLGIGENGHIAFNDPHEAQFDDPQIVKITTLDERCRQQQVNDGEFADLSLVPKQAMTLTIPTLMSCRCVVGIVPLARKAQAVRDALYGPVSEHCPASILRTHDNATLFLDRGAASGLNV